MKKINKILGFLFLSCGFLLLFGNFTIKKATEIKETRKIETKVRENNSYFAILEIPKISLKKELFSINDSQNQVDKNILVHSKSIFPSEENSYIILAGHSGNGKNAYFKNLYKLKKGHELKLYYQNNIYTYEILAIEEQNKTGTLDLRKYADALVLITCTKNNSKTQTIYYSKLKNTTKIANFS